jgi:hypothetical protein
MWSCGGILIVLALPLLIGFALSNKKNPMWLRLGILMIVVGVLIIVAGRVAGI